MSQPKDEEADPAKSSFEVHRFTAERQMGDVGAAGASIIVVEA